MMDGNAGMVSGAASCRRAWELGSRSLAQEGAFVCIALATRTDRTGRSASPRGFGFLSRWAAGSLLLVVAQQLSGCASPTHLMNLPTTIPSARLGVVQAVGGAPESSDIESDGSSEGDEARTFNVFLSTFGLNVQHPVGERFILGVQADYTMFTSGQLSASASYKPFPSLVGSSWVGVDPRAGSVGGVEVMTGSARVSAGGGAALVRSVSFVNHGFDCICPNPSWRPLVLGYARSAVGWKGYALDLLVGRASEAWQPWMWQATIRFDH